MAERVDNRPVKVEVKNLTKKFGDLLVLDNLNFNIKKNEFVCVVGPTGCGKTTFLKMLLGEEEPDGGRIRWGSNVNIAYLPQKVSFINEYNSMVEEVMQALKVTSGTARGLLGKYHFVGEDVFKMVGDLSGGERSRLRLCILMYAEVNLLILDEPTNHLDIASCEWMEEAIENYEGTLLFVSHDRYFINRFATRVWQIKDSRIEDFKGTFAEFQLDQEKKARDAKSAPPPPKPVEEEKPKKTNDLYEAEKKRRADKKRASALERRIGALEEEIAGIDAALAEAASDHKELLRLLAEREEKQTSLDALYEEWSEIAE